MRSLFAVLFVLLFFIFGIIYLGIEWVISKCFPKSKKKSDLRQLRVVQWAFRVVLWISGVKVNVIGKENIPTDEAVLYIGNHRSIFDVVITYPECPGLTGYISKDAIRKVPFLRVFMRRLHCQFIVRDDLKQSLKVILDAIDLVKNGISVCIFPEGTRCKEEDPTAMLPFKDGSFKIASKTGCKIIPFAMQHTNEIFEDHLPWIKKKKITLVYGEPIIFSELEKEDQKNIGAYCQQKVKELMTN